MAANNEHWGKWLWQRAVARGFISQGEFAQCVGMTRPAATRMFQRAKPTRMEHRIVNAICEQLQLTEAELRRSWRDMSDVTPPSPVPPTQSLVTRESALSIAVMTMQAWQNLHGNCPVMQAIMQVLQAMKEEA